MVKIPFQFKVKEMKQEVLLLPTKKLARQNKIVNGCFLFFLFLCSKTQHSKSEIFSCQNKTHPHMKNESMNLMQFFYKNNFQQLS